MSIHFRREDTKARSICSISGIGVELTDDKKKVTCKSCLKAMKKPKKEFSFKHNERIPARRSWE